jgi:hypothetical protein
MRTFLIALAAIVFLTGCGAETLGPDALLDSTVEIEIDGEWWPLASVATDSLDDDTRVRVTTFRGQTRIVETTWGGIKCQFNPDCTT